MTNFIHCSVMTKDEETFTAEIYTLHIPRVGETLWIEHMNPDRKRERTVCKVIDVCHWVIAGDKYQHVALYVELST